MDPVGFVYLIVVRIHVLGRILQHLGRPVGHRGPADDRRGECPACIGRFDILRRKGRPFHGHELFDIAAFYMQPHPLRCRHVVRRYETDRIALLGRGLAVEGEGVIRDGHAVLVQQLHERGRYCRGFIGCQQPYGAGRRSPFIVRSLRP